MRLGVLNDFVPGSRGGGANRAISLYLKEAQQRYAPRQLELVLCTPGNVERKCDAYLLFLTKTFSDAELDYVQDQPFVECGFDWWPDEDGNPHWRNLLYEKAALSIFVSPLHQERFCKLYCIASPSFLILPPPLESVQYGSQQRNGLGVWASEWHAAKGPDLAAVLARRLQLHTDFYSPSMPPSVTRLKSVFVSFAHPKGFCPEDEWYVTLAQYSKLLHTPRVPDAFGYIMLEAYMLGLEVNVSGQTGVESYDMPWSQLLTWCHNSADDFWTAVEGAL